MKLPPTSPHLTLSKLPQKTMDAASKIGNPQQNQQGLGGTFEGMLQEVNQLQIASETKQTEFLTSPNKDLHGTIIAMEKADISLRLMMQVRNKVVSAYEEVMRTQI